MKTERKTDKMDRKDWHFRPNTQDEFIYNEVYVENCYRLPDDLSDITIIDIGANIGAFTIACLDRGAKVFAYEPDKDNFAQLFQHVNKHPLHKNCWKFSIAVVGNEASQDVYISNEYSTLDGTRLTGGKSISVECGVPVSAMKIRQVLSMALLDDNPIWLKLDCEGSEYGILLSSLPWDRIERVFGECHDLIDGRVSKHTERVSLGLSAREANRKIIRERLEEVGYQVEMVPNSEDEHLSLFFAVKPRLAGEKSPFCSQCGQHFSDPACGPTHALIAHEGGFIEERDSNLPEIYDTHGSENSIVNALKYADEYEKAQDTQDKLTRTVCILTPFRNARRYLPLYFSQMAQLRDLLESEGYGMRIVAAEGDSLDGTRERIGQLASEYGLNVKIVDTTHGHMRWSSVEDPIRMKVMSDVMNKALNQVQESDDIVVWIMSDLQWHPSDLTEMIYEVGHNRDKILAPMIFLDQEQTVFYDTWAFRGIDGKRFTVEYPYHQFIGNDIKWHNTIDVCTRISSAGSCLVMSQDIARQGRAYKEEAVSFCQSISAIASVWTSLKWKMNHAPLPKKRLLWISDAVCISGFSRVSHSIFPQLVEAGYDLDIIALNYFGEPHNFPYTIYPASVQGDDPSGNLRAKYLLYNAHKEDRPYDLIVKLDDPWNIKGLTLALETLEREYKVPSPPVLAWITVDGKNINRKDFQSVSRIVCVTEFGLNEIGGVPSDPLIPFGVDTSIFHPLGKVESRRLVCSSEIPIDAFIIGVVSTNQLRKRLDLVLCYFAEWINQYKINNAYLYLCLGPDDRSGCDIQSLVRYYGLQSRVILNDSLLNDPAMAYVYNSFDVYLSLSQGEGFGLTTLESLACGVPCVVSDWAAYSSWVPESATYKIPCTSTAMSSPLNAQSYVIGGVADKTETIGALQKLYLYSELREKMGQKGVEFAREMTWKSTGEKLIVEIEKAISKADDKEMVSAQVPTVQVEAPK